MGSFTRVAFAEGRRRQAWGAAMVALFVAQHLLLRRHLPAWGGSADPPVAEAPVPLSTAQRQLLAPSADDRLTVVVFFASWCVPCRIELPQLQQLYHAHQAQGLRLVGVYDAASAADIDPFVAQLGLSFPLVEDAQEQWSQAFEVSGLPSVVVVDRHLQVVRRSRGYDPRLVAWLRRQLEAASAHPAVAL